MSLQCRKPHVQSVGCCGAVTLHKSVRSYRNILLPLWDNLEALQQRGKKKSRRKSRELAGRLLDIEAMQDNNIIVH